MEYLHRLTSVSDEYFVRTHFELMYIEWNIQRVSQKNIWKLWEKCWLSDYITILPIPLPTKKKQSWIELKIFAKPAGDRRSLLIWNLFSFFLNSVSQLDKNNTEMLPFTSSDLALCKITISGPGMSSELTRIILPMNDLPSQEPNLNYCPTFNEGSPPSCTERNVGPLCFFLSPSRHWW